MIRYCYIKPDLSFSGSWSEKDHKQFFTKELEELVTKGGYRVMKYEVVLGKDFEFPYESTLISTPKQDVES